MTIYGYVREGKNTETEQQQRDAIVAYAEAQALCVDTWLTVKNVKRSNAIKNADKWFAPLKKLNKGDTLVVSKLFRLGRTLEDIADTLKRLLENGVIIYSVEDDLSFGNDLMAPVMAYCFGVASDIAKEVRSQSTKEALTLLKNNGKKLGRYQGSPNFKLKLDDKKNELLQLLPKRLSYNRMGKCLGVSGHTVKAYLQLHPELMENANA